MAIVLNLESTTLAYGSRANSAMTKPTNTVDTDFLFAGLYVEDNSSLSVSVPTGWTLIYDSGTKRTDARIIIAYKRASGEGSSWVWTHTTATTAAFCQRLTGVVESGDPEDCTRSNNSAAGSSTVTWTGITTANDGVALMGACVIYYQSNLGSTTLTERIDTGNGIYLCSDLQASAGASGNKVGTTTGTENWVSVLIGLKPAVLATLAQTAYRWRDDDAGDV